MTAATHARRERPSTAWSCCATMLRIRRFEERCAELYSAAKIRGFLHLYIGEEAVAVGVMPALEPEDAVVSTYREHGHALARGVPTDGVMAEMFGRRGLQPRPRRLDAPLRRRRRFYGGNAIVGGGLPLAVGLALADKHAAARRRVTACFFGDGAVAEGEFHECDQPGRAVAAAGAVLLREQPATRWAPRSRAPRPRPTWRCKARELRDAGVGGRRHGRRSPSRRPPAGPSTRPRRRRPVLPGAAHLPLPRALDVRPRALPRQGRGRALEGARPDRRCSRRGCAPTGELDDDGARPDRGRGRRRDRRGGRVRRGGAAGAGRGPRPGSSRRRQP